MSDLGWRQAADLRGLLQKSMNNEAHEGVTRTIGYNLKGFGSRTLEYAGSDEGVGQTALHS